jgi:beta-glucanase (GH16 family)
MNIKKISIVSFIIILGIYISTTSLDARVIQQKNNTHNIAITASSSSKLALSILSIGDTKITASGSWILRWQDEFNTASVNTSNWNILNSSWGGVINNYKTDHVSVANGSLIIKTDKVHSGGYNYTSGFLSSKDSLAYGRVEVRAKLPIAANVTSGMWPGIWLLASDHDTGGYSINNLPPEIDMMEAVGNYPYKIWTTYHVGTYNSGNYGNLSNPTNINFSSDYHVYAIEWENNEIRWYIDDVQVFSVNQQITNKPMTLIINTAVGDEGYMGTGIGHAPNKKNVFPQYLSIDYVRVYQR